MEATIVLSKEPSSAMFEERVLTISNEPLTISRSSKDERADPENGIFNCKVIMIYFSLSHARCIVTGSVQTSRSDQLYRRCLLPQGQWQ